MPRPIPLPKSARMPTPPPPASQASPKRLLHIFRSPVGGLFRYVRDLVAAQAALGHHVGCVYDGRFADALSASRLRELSESCTLGCHPLPNGSGLLGLQRRLNSVRSLVQTLEPDIIHAHGAEGGMLGRGCGVLHRSHRPRPLIIYSPHGGAAHRFSGALGLIYTSLESLAAIVTDLTVFESAATHTTFQRHLWRHSRGVVIHNGVTPPVALAPPDDAVTDFLFIGELRLLKGVDVLLRALRDTTSSLTIVGDGPDGHTFRTLAEALGMSTRVRFVGAMPIESALPLGECLVVPSLREGLPYVVLEAAAAGKPLIATSAGGIPEIFGPSLSQVLLPPGDTRALSEALQAHVSSPESANVVAQALRSRVLTHFTIERMAGDVLRAYALAAACGTSAQ